MVGLLVFVSATTSRFSAHTNPTGEHDYVDNNVSDVDASADMGTHSNFTAQQYGPDSINDTLTEADTSASDNNNVDSEIVTYGFTTGISGAQTVDSMTENMTERAQTPVVASYASNEADGVTSISVNKPTGTSGGDLLIIVCTTDGTGSSLSINDNTFSVLMAEEQVQGQTAASWYKEANASEPSSYSVSWSGTEDSVIGCFRITGWDSTDFPHNSARNDGTAQTVFPSVTTTKDDCLLLRFFGMDDDDDDEPIEGCPADHTELYALATTDQPEECTQGACYRNWTTAGDTGTATWTHTSKEGWYSATIAIAPSEHELEIEHVVNSVSEYENYNLTTRAYRTAPENYYLQLYNFTSSQWVNMSTITASSLTWYNTSFAKTDFVNSTNQTRIRYWQDVDATQETLYVDYSGVYGWNATNYELDLEVQWTNVNYTQTYEELCIFGGTMGSENIRVDVWSGSTWHNLFIDLSSGWNNVSVTDYLVSSVFTIRFKGGTETGDTFQDSWEIDCALLHTWGVAPTANFSYTPEYPYTGETVTFDASDSYDPDGSIVSHFWDFGDGTNGTDEVTNHFYTDDGNYTVFLTVTDNDGLSDTTSADIIVLNRPPVATFTESAENVYTDETITFNASESYDPDGTIASYYWDFGDGTNATGITVEHAYVDDGNYTVALTVTDDDGATASAIATKTVLNRSPVAVFTESAETVYVGEPITFNASESYDPDGTIVSYFWDFGDDTNATGVIVQHAYATNGTYTVTLTVTDDDGASDLASSAKTILRNDPPVASFIESAETVHTGEAITFNASDSYDPDGTIMSYFWNFGDGTNATGVVVTHIYIDDGNYTVTLTVIDDRGATDNATATKTVLNRSPAASFTESAETVYTNDVITFNASASSDPDGVIVSYEWDFGDGTNATGITVEHAYVDDGNYTVALTVTDDDGATDTVISVKTVLNRSPVTSFTESAETVHTGEFITFNASESYDPDGYIVSYFWDFGDGTNATGVIVSHAYVDDGNYTVTLTVTDDDDATASTTATKKVLNLSPIASFTESVETVYTGEAIAFNASDSYDPDGLIVSYEWDFGDGTNATGVVVEHSYVDDGIYNVTLTVTDNDGATTSISATKTVLNRPPVASFTYTPESPAFNETVTFNASDSYDEDGYIVSYMWDFGDGNITTVAGVIITHAYTAEATLNVTLTVTDDDGLTDSLWKLITVGRPHDVIIINTTYMPTVAYANTTPPINITVVVRNNGTIAETFNVTAYYNITATEWASIDTQTVTQLDPLAETTLYFIWNTTTLPLYVNYTLKIETSPIPNDINPADNTVIAGTLMVKMLGDVNGDCRVESADLIFGFATAYGSRLGDPNHNPNADFNGNGWVDSWDLIFGLAPNYGKSWSD